MPATTIVWANPAVFISFTDTYAYYDTINISPARTAANGQGPMLISNISAWTGATGSSATVTFSLGSISTSPIIVGNPGQAVKVTGTTGFQLLANGGNLRFQISSPDSFWVGRTNGGGTSFNPYGTFAGILAGDFTYVQSPTAPQSPGVSAGVGQATVSWSAPSDDGGASITGYRVQYATDAGFTTGVGTKDVGVVTSTTITGLTNGTTYYFRVYAKNAVTTAAGTTSVASSSVSTLISIWTASGSASYQFTITAVGTFPNVVTVDLEHTIDVTDLDPGEVYSAAIQINYSWSTARSTNLRILPYFEWQDSNGSALSTVPLAVTNLYSGATLFTWSSMTKPALAVTGVIRLTFPQTNSVGTANFTVGDRVYADAAMLVNGPIVPYFDGNSPGASWLGTTNNSVSSQPAGTVENILYDAADDNNQIYSVGVGETQVTTIKTNNFPTAVAQPEQTETLPLGGGEYYVIDRDGNMVTIAEWEGSGALVQVAIGSSLGSFNLTMYGPNADIPGKTGPFYLAYMEDDVRFAALSIAGSGVTSDPITLVLPTGADPVTTTTEVAVTIDSAFIDSLLDAYDRATWAMVDAAGPKTSITFDISTHQLVGFGVTSGSLVRYDDSIYRITSCTIAGLRATITAQWYVTAEEFDNAWSGQTAGQLDTLWSGYEAGDMVVAPLRVE